MQCYVEFGYQLSICSGIEETRGNPSLSWSVAEPSGCKLTSSQQPGIKYANPNISPYLAVDLFVKEVYILLSTDFFFIVHTLDEQQTVVYNICGGKA
jgi:hypothetical protein